MPRALSAVLSAVGLAIFLGVSAPVLAQSTGPSPGFSGAFLAARSAAIERDHAAAATYLTRALEADPGNLLLIENALLAHASLGEWERAATLIATQPEGSLNGSLADLIELVRFLQQNEFDEARELLAAGRGLGALGDGLLLAWIALAEGDVQTALSLLQDIAGDDRVADLALLHMAYARGMLGDFAGAEALLSGAEAGPLAGGVRGAQARIAALLQLGRREEALALIDEVTETLPDSMFLQIRDRIATRDDPEAYQFITKPQEGMAEVFYGLAQILSSDQTADSLALVYARAAQALDPSHDEAWLLAGRFHARDEQYRLAADTFFAIRPGMPRYIDAQIALADALRDGDRIDEAFAVLETLADTHPDLALVQFNLGEHYRFDDRCADALAPYDRALELTGGAQSPHWYFFFARGTCLSLLGEHEESERDLRAALALNPAQPTVLNNLGYALVEQRRNLDEALDLIERAVAADPNSGYIVDSLGWALYRLGRFEDAVAPMEQAVELTPNDPIINDHLGDVYWMVGRHREAIFQWNRALSFEPAEEDLQRIRRKLEIGLDAVLAEEGGVGAQP